MDLERINDERRKLGRPALTRAQAEHARTARSSSDTDFMSYMIMYAVMTSGHSEGSPHVDHAHDTPNVDTGSPSDSGSSPDTSSSTPDPSTP